MKNTYMHSLFALALSFSLSAQNTTIGDVDMGGVKNSDAFNQVKKLLGKWEGKLYQQSGAVVDTYSEFRLVSNGNAIVETLVEDGVEMMTTYSDKDGKLVVKHYCALGTEPMFEVESMNENSLFLKSDPAPGYHPKHHNYVESIGWTFNDADNVRVDASLHLDGELQVQHSIIKRVD
ncbi:MAG: hypothetical protein ACPG78_03470 [Gammaproteobacteria bacterium]|jgi:hypothetical protein